MIGLSRARFPKGTTGAQIDVFARQHLWSSGQNYLHGTGHGVGFFLNVHEGPQGFSSGTTVQAQTPIVPGMVTSNEPGYYLEDHFGIRIENLILCVESQYEDYYEFETITYFPIDSKAIISNKMTRAEIDWINDYNQIVYDKLSPHLDAEAQNWLALKCKSI
jgi:Xaa-Pro aminopeptidase